MKKEEYTFYTHSQESYRIPKKGAINLKLNLNSEIIKTISYRPNPTRYLD